MDTKIRDAFEKVKLDVTLLRENLLANYKEDRNREKTVIKLTEEVIALKRKVRALETKKAPTKKKVVKKVTKKKAPAKKKAVKKVVKKKTTTKRK